MIIPTARPVITGSIPASSSAAQTATPSTATSGARQAAGTYRSGSSARNSTAATISGVELDALGVHGRDHQQRDQVVEHRDREQRDPQARAARRHQRQQPERERGVGRHRGAPAAGAFAAGVEGDVDEHGEPHAAERRAERGRDAPAVAQLADVELALGLEPDDEEEERHQPLVDPLAQLERDAVVAEADRELGGPDRLVGVRPRRVRPQQGGDRGAQQHERAAALGVQEVAQRRRQVARPRGRVSERRDGHVRLPERALSAGARRSRPAGATPRRAR